MASLKSVGLARDLKILFGSGTMTGLGDGQLLERFVTQGEDVAFEELMARHGPTVLGVCRRWLDDPQDIEDAFQATFLLLVRKAGSLRDRHTLSSWLYGVALRVARRARAKANRRRKHEQPIFQEPIGHSPASSDWAGGEVGAIIGEEIRRLPDKQQLAVILCLLEGTTHEAAARKLGWRLGTVKSRIAAARQTLSRRLTRRGLAPSMLPAALSGGRPCPLPPHLVRLTLDAAHGYLAKPWLAAVGSASAAGLVREVGRVMLLTKLQSVMLVAMAVVPLAWAAPGLLDAQPTEEVAQAPPAPKTRPPAAAAPSKPKVDLYGDPLPSGAAMRLGTIRHREVPSIGLLSYTLDGRSLITVTQRRLQFRDTRDGRKVREIDVKLDSVDDFALSPDGKTIAVAGYQYEVTGRYLYRLRLIDIASGLFGQGGEWTQRGEIIKIGYSPDGKTVAVVSDNGTLRLWDAATALLLKEEPLGVNRVMDIDFSRDPTHPLMAIGSDHDISIRGFGPTDKFRIIATQDRYRGSTHVALSPDGSILAGVMPGSHGEIQIWRTSDGTRLNRLKLRKNQTPYRMTFSPDGKLLVLNGNHQRFEAFDVATGEEPESFSGIDLANGPIAFAADGKSLAFAGDWQTLHIWDLETGKDRLATPDAHQGYIGALAFLPDGKTLISGSDDRTVRVWDLKTGKPTKTLPHDGWVRSLSVSADGSRLATASEYPGTVRVWDLTSGTRLYSWDARRDEPNSYYVRGVTLDADGTTVIAAVGDGSLRRWDGSTGKEQPSTKLKLEWNAPEEGPPDHMDALARTIFSRDGRTAAMINQVQRMLVVDIASGEVRFKDRASFMACAIAPDGRSLAVGKRGLAKKIPLADGRPREGGSASSWLIAWLDAQTGRVLREIEIPESTVNTLTFSPDGKTIAAGTIRREKNGMIRIFRLRDLKELQSFEVPCHLVGSLAFTPDGKRLAAGLNDTSILIWDLKPIE